MNAFIEVAPSRVAVYKMDGVVIWEANPQVSTGNKVIRRLAIQILEEQPTTLQFNKDGKVYRLRSSDDLAARLAAVL